MEACMSTWEETLVGAELYQRTYQRQQTSPLKPGPLAQTLRWTPKTGQPDKV